jgi:hypothetical protein
MYLIDIKKLSETAQFAEYSFSASEAETSGILRIDKTSGRITLVRPIAGGRIGDRTMGQWREPERYFQLAARKVAVAWEGGALPDSLTWAS